MSIFQFIALAPTTPFGSLERPAIAIAASRAGHVGVIDPGPLFDTPERADFARIFTSLNLVKTAAPDGKTGLRLNLCALKLLLENERYETELASVADLLIVAGTEEKPDLGFLCSSKLQSLRARGVLIAAEVFSLEEVKTLQNADDGDYIDYIIARGTESAGLTGETSSFIFLQELVNELANPHNGPGLVPVLVQGGVGRHSVAAIKAGGAAGVILDSQLYLASDSQVAQNLKELIGSMDGSETRKIWLKNGRSFRCLASRGAAEQKLNDLGKEVDFDALQELLVHSTGEYDLLPLGQDAALAAGLARDGNTIAGIIEILQNSIESYPEIAAISDALSPDSPLALSHGTKFPVVQGALTRVSDNAEFALAVAENGALPFLALSLMREREASALLTSISEKVNLTDKKFPWGVGLLGFLPSQLHQEQMRVLSRFKPPYALIAGGRPDQARSLETLGIKTYLHAPSPLILRSYLESGCRRFVFEGNECGGHVGPRTSFLLWEQMIDVLLEFAPPKEESSDFHILFAGGIHDALSAKMVATMAAPLSKKGMKVGVLVGTAYLYTKEAVATGAIVEQFQKKALDCDQTVLLETGPGHAIRCIKSPYQTEFEKRKEELLDKSKNKGLVKEELELLHLGRLRIASKGLLRDGGKLRPVEEKEQWSLGMYMIGQLSSMRKHITTMYELHQNISEEGARLVLADRVQSNPLIEADRSNDTLKEPVAIVGMACNLPLSNDVEQFWRNILDRVNAIEEVPASHWSWEKFYDPDRFATDKAISKWGGFIKDIVFNPTVYGIPPSSLASIDPIQLLMLEVVRQAMEDAGYSHRHFPRKKSSMVLANAGHGPVAARYALRCMLDNELDGFLDEKTKEAIRLAMPDWTEDSLPGNLSNVTAGRVANRFDLGGINFCVDAACASSLAALYVAVNDLRSGISDMVILGSADTHNNPIDFLNFSKTHALSESGRCKTFDASADGIVLGEGIAALVLKRLSDAERDGNKIYALVKGVGGSSDGRALSLTAPRPEGQMSALERAYEDAGVSPASVSLVEAHGTGTVAGDRAEVEALGRIFTAAGAAKNSCAIGSVKTNIGHTKCTAGLASTIKVAKSLFHKVLPPTIGVVEPNQACNFDKNPFYINTHSRPWINKDPLNPRRAAVSAFGFGGTNFHAVLEEYRPVMPPVNEFASALFPAELFVYRARTLEELNTAVRKTQKDLEQILAVKELGLESKAVSLDKRRLQEVSRRAYNRARIYGQTDSVDGKIYSCALVANSLDDLRTKLNEFLNRQQSAKSLKDPRGIYFSNTAWVADNKIGFLFPGQGSQRPDMLLDLSLHFPEIRQELEEADKALANCLEKPLSTFVYPPPTFDQKSLAHRKHELDDTRVSQPALGTLDMASMKILDSFGIKPDMVAGHSYGEYVALWAAGVLNKDALTEISAERGQILSAPHEPGSMLAVFSSGGIVESLVDDHDGVTIANHNSPLQTVVAGSSTSIESFSAKAQDLGLVVKSVAVSQAFHSPLMESASQELADKLRKLEFSKPKLAIFSNTTGEAYSKDPEQIRETLIEHTTAAVKFSHQLKNMQAAGAKVIIECGPGAILTALVESNFPDREVVALSLEKPGKDGFIQLLTVLAQLWSLGYPLDLNRLFEDRWGHSDYASIEAQIESRKSSKLNYRVNSNHLIDLNSGKAIGRTKKRTTGTLSEKRQTVPKVMPSSFSDNSVEQVMLAYQKNLLDATNNFIDAQKEVMLAYLKEARSSDSPKAAKVDPSTWLTSSRDFQQELVEQQLPVTESPTPEPTTGQTLEIEKLIERLYDIVSERTGYPIEMLDPTLDLEADLGIDSIKRIEIFNSFRKLLPSDFKFELESAIEELAELKTLDAISNWIRNLEIDQIADLAISSSSRSKEVRNALQKLTSIEVDPKQEKASGNSSLRRERVILAESTRLLDKENDGSGSMPESVLYIFDDNTALADGFIDEFETVLKTRGVRFDKLHTKQVSLVFDFIERTRPSWILFAGAENNSPHMLLQLTKELKALHLKEPNYHPTLIVGTALGGDLLYKKSAYERPTLRSIANQSALIGMVNTIALELDFIRSFSIDTGPLSSGSCLFDLGLAGVSKGEYVLDGERVLSPLTVPHVDESDRPKEVEPLLNESSLVLVTGGARGITAESTIALAREYRCNFLILGQSELPGPEPALTRGLTDAKEIKALLLEAESEALNQGTRKSAIREVESAYKRLLKDREIRDNLARIKKYAASVRYHAVDVRNEKELSSCIESIYEVYGSIDGVIHGAGIIEDALISDKSVESFERVFDTKVKAAITLADKLRLDSLKFLCFFSSVVGRTGNPGQIDYVAANQALNKIALHMSASTETRVKSIMWGPWKGGMAPPELERVFESFGWGMIAPEAGSKAFLNELKDDLSEVILVGDPASDKTSAVTVLTSQFTGPVIQPATILTRTPMVLKVPVHITNHVYLEDHKLDSVPVLPMSVALEMILEAATLAFGGRRVMALSDFDIPAGVIFDSDQKNFEVTIEPLDLDSAMAKVESVGSRGSRKLHHKTRVEFKYFHDRTKGATTLLGSRVPFLLKEDKLPDFESDLLRVDNIYTNWLFHGPRFQGIQQIEKLAPQGIRGTVKGQAPADCLAISGGAQWILDPTLFDSAMQLGAVWARFYSDITCLPTGFNKLHLFETPDRNGATVRVYTVDKTFDGEVICDLAIYNADGKLALLVESLAGIGSKSFNRFAGSAAILK
ncbi:MAG: SDR family NAD(P)-dependent oxidoreductase [Candidatus Obscuribacterales bacterium]|nr:SDR family NAD(P)-dependent oxidoreductase [Candidatus Obscuribacterales bacterium]